MENQPNPITAPQTPPKKSHTAIIVAVVVVAVVIVLITGMIVLSSIAANSKSGNNNNNDNDNTYTPPPPEPDIRYVSATFTQESISGDTVVKVKVTNLGDAIGSATIKVTVTEKSGTYSNTKYVTLAPGETQTYEVTVNTPFGTTVTSSMVGVDVIEA